jgi:hypothetical protein
MTKYFICFVDEKYIKTQNRIVEEAKSMNIFDYIIGYQPKDFDKDFINRHSEFIKSNPRGYGYWIWKSYFVLKTMEKMNDGDILLYADSGCKMNNNEIAKKRMNDYIDYIKDSKYGIIAYPMPFNIEKCYTKMDTMNELECMDYEYQESEQICATAFIIRKNTFSLNLMKKWYEYSCNYHLLDDSLSILNNDLRFLDHRHDQSIFSLLLKKYGYDKFTNHYEFGIHYPISDLRLRY